eukprot:6028061-Pleurochrysis_carterae.AAC.3
MIMRFRSISLNNCVKDDAEWTIAVEAKLLTVKRWAHVSTPRHRAHRGICVRRGMKADFVAETESAHHDDVHSLQASNEGRGE